MYKAIAMGKVSAKGTILKATPGIKVSTKILPGNILGGDIGYKLTLPDRLVNDANYIVQLTAENYGEDGPDYVTTSIALRYQSKKGFEVIIWGDRGQTIGGLHPVRTDWYFVIYDICC